MHPKDRTGLLGEQRAAQYLLAQGHEILACRWRSRHGELDLVTSEAGTLVAVEVKTRRGLGYGHPFEAITAQKLKRLYRLLNEYAVEQGLRFRQRRVDIISVLMGHPEQDNSSVTLEHLRGVQL